MITITQSLPSNPINKQIPPRSYGSSSSNTYAYTNFGSDDLADEEINTPCLHFSCEYNPSALNIKLNIQNLRHMNIFHTAINSNAYVSIRFSLSPPTKSNQSYETIPQPYEDFIRFGDTFIILNNIYPGDLLDYQIKFLMIILINNQIYEIAEGIHSMKDNCLTYILFIERILPMNLKLIR